MRSRDMHPTASKNLNEELSRVNERKNQRVTCYTCSAKRGNDGWRVARNISQASLLAYRAYISYHNIPFGSNMQTGHVSGEATSFMNHKHQTQTSSVPEGGVADALARI